MIVSNYNRLALIYGLECENKQFANEITKSRPNRKK